MRVLRLALFAVLFVPSLLAFGQTVDMTAAISDTPDPVTVNTDDIVYTATLTNNTSGVSAGSPTLTITIPAASVIQGMSANNSGSCTSSGPPTITCTWPAFTGFAQRQATIAITPTSGGTYTATAVASASNETNTSNNSASTTTTVNASIDLAVTSTSDSPNDITLGQGNVTYSISTYNYTTSKATNAVLTVGLPASSSYVSHTVSNSGSCTPSGGVLTCTWAQQNGNTNHSVTVTVTPGVGGTNSLTASISGDQADSNSANNSRTETTTVNDTINLAVTGISDSPSDITLGQGDVTYTISTYNYSSSKATNPVVEVTFPASSTYVAHTVTGGGVCTPTAASMTCTWTQQNASTGYTVTVTLTPGAGGTNTLTAAISADQGDPTPANNTASEATTVNATINLAVTNISDSPTDITLGQGNVTYTISTYNYSTSKATNPVLTATLPASSVYVSHTVSNSGTCSESGGTLTCTWAQQNASTGHTVTVTVTPGAGGTNTLSASIAADQGDPTPANNTLTENTTVNDTINLAVTNINDSPADITLGQGNVTYTISTYNYSTSKATNPVLTATLPASSTYVSHTVTNSGTCSESGGVLTCNWAQQNASTGHTVTVTVTPGVGGTNTLTASIAADQGDPTPANNSMSEATVVNATINLGVTNISDNPTDITLGQGNVTYTVNTYNYSSSKATNPVLTITLPASATYVSHTVNNSGTCTPSGGTLTCNWAQQNAFTGHSLTVTVTPGAGGTNTLSASIAADQGDPTPSNNTLSENTTVNATIDLAVTGISDNPADITLGHGNVVYTVNTYNYTSSKATNPALTVTLPASSTYVSHTVNNSGTCTPSGGTLTCNWTQQNAFTGHTVTVTVTPGTGGTNTLTAAIAADQGDHQSGNNSVSENTTVNATINLAVTGISDSPADITLGTGNVTYSINTYNYSTSKATNPVLTVTLPASSTYVSHTVANSGTCTPAGGVVTCNWPQQNAFTNHTVTVVVTPGAGGTNTLSASIAADQGDPTPSNNSLSENTTVNATIDLQLSMSDSPDPRVLAAGNVTYSVNLYNATSSKATNPLFTFNVPATTTFVSATPNTGSCSHNAGVVTCAWSDHPAYTSRTVSIVVTPAAVGQISATASVGADQVDPNTSNNSATATTNINPGSPPTITSFTPASGPAGTTVTITGSNFFSSTAVKFNGASSTFTVDNNGSITAIVPGSATTGPIAITNSVGTTTSGSSFTVTAKPDLTISKTASAASVPTGTPVTYTLAVSNSGNGATHDVTVVDTLPPDVTLTAVSGTGWNCSGATTITCTMGPLAALTGAPNITIDITAPPSGTTITNSATVATTTPEVSTANNAGSVSVSVVGCPTTPAITAPATVCANSTGHTASTPAVPSATYAWSITNGTIVGSSTGNAVTFDASGTDPITLSVSVFVSSCPTATNSATVNVSTPAASITASGPTTFCPGGSVTLTASAGASYLWSTGETTQSIEVTTSENITVQVTNAAGCSATSSPAVVTVNPAAITPVISAGGPTTFCAGGSVALISSEASGNQWKLNGAPISGATGQNFVASFSGSYTVVYTDANGCSSESAPMSVNAAAPPPTPTVSASGPTSFCTGGSVTLTSSAASGNQWKLNGAILSGQTAQTLVATAAGNYSVAVTDGNGCSAESAPVAVQVNPIPPAPTVSASGPTTFCTGGSVTLTSSEAGSNQWKKNGILIGGETAQTLVATAAGSYTVLFTDANGCSAESAAVTVQVDPSPAAPTVTPLGPTTFCAGGDVTLVSSESAGNQWKLNGTPIGGATTDTFVATASGSYTVVYVDGGGCAAESAPVVVTVEPLPPQPSISASGPLAFCSGGSVTLTSSAAGGNQWKLDGSIIGGATSQTYLASVAGTYTVEVTNGSCSSASAPVTVTVNTPQQVTIGGPASSCGNATVVLDAGPGFASYNWSNGATTQQITVSPAVTTSYAVTVVDGNGCSTNDAHTITVTPTPSTTIAAPAAVCESSAGNHASVPAQPGATYAWTITNGTITSAANANAVTFTAGASGSVALNVTVTNGSCAVPGSVNVPIVAYPSVTITGPTSVCPSTNLTLGVDGSFATYLWSNGATTPTITVNQSDPTHVYSVTVTSAAGCAATDTHTVTLSANPDATITAPASAPAFSSQSASVPAQAGAAYLWTISNGTITGGQGTDSITFDTGTSGTTNLGVQVTIGSCAASDGVAIAIDGVPPPCPTLVPSLTAPADGATVSSPVLLQWGAVGGATSYDVFVNGTLRTTVSTASATLPLPSGPATWSIVARAGNCRFPSSTRTFTVQEGTTCNTNGRAQLTAPAANSTTASPVTFSWSFVPNAVGYRVLVQINGAAAEEIGATNGATTLTAGVPPGAIVAYVDSLFNGCAPTRSEPLLFTVPAPDPCAARATAIPVAPENGATVDSSSVLFRWNAAGGATGYRVWASIDGAKPEVLGTTAETSLRTNVGRGTVIWWVEALYDGCASTESQRVQFTIPAAQNCGTARSETITPANGSIVSSGDVTFTWSGVAGALGYEVYLSLAGGTPSLLGTTSGATSLTRGVPAGELEWFVRALVDRCPPRDSQSAQFTYQQPESCAANQRPVAIEPVERAKSASPVTFDWSDTAGATSYEVYVVRGETAPQLVATTTASHANAVSLGTGRVRWFVRAHFAAACPVLDSAERALEIVSTPVACTPLPPPVISAPAQISAGGTLRIQWSPVAGATAYQLQLANDSAFTGAQIIDTNATQHTLTANGTLYARVRAVDARCSATNVSPFGPSSAIVLLPATASEGSTPLSDPTPIHFTFLLGAEYAGQTFTAVSRQPWLSVAPASGVVAPNGTTLTVVATTTGLPVGTTFGGLTITLSSPAAGGIGTNNSTVISPNFSVGMVTPVTPSPNDTPPPDALIIPAVAHADGINSHFQSDVRVSNTSARLITYQVTFTPSGDSGITRGMQTEFAIEPGRTVALDDVLKSWFGTGESGSAMGMLEIRPLTQTNAAAAAFGMLANLTTFASSRTFNVTSNGTFGQYIPAVPFANFVGRDRLLSLQQIAQSSKYRTNLGLVEGSGNPASLIVRVFGESGQYLTEFDVQLRGGQHLQLNSFLQAQGIGTLNDGRVEIEVASGDGLVTAYASVLDSETSDPLLVTPVTVDGAGSTKWVVPGVADLASGFANWQTDLRLFNAGAQPVEATFTFHSQSGGEPKVHTLTIGPGQVRQFDQALVSLFGTSNDAGAVHITTAEPSRLIATARTFNQTGSGTYGQFISAVTVPETAGLGSRPLQLLQVEESERFRSNIGIAEVTGKPVRLEISAVPPDAKFSAFTELELKPNEFRQLGSLLKSMGLDDTHNARVTVHVIDGEGRVTAYASVIDMKTNDPTYVPAQ